MRPTRNWTRSARRCRTGVKVQTFYDQSTLVRDSIASVRDAILIGLVLAAIILVLFLRDWGSSLVAALVIPATIAITLIALRAMGQSFNLMTLGGLAAAVGLVIDDAIVVVENIVLHRDSGQSRGEAIRSALREIRVPLVGSTITPIVVFLPLISITGVTGTFFRALARDRRHGAADFAGAGAHLDSDAQPLPAAPHGDPGIRLRSTDPQGHAVPTGFMGRVTRAYERTLRFVLAYPLVFGVACIALIGGSYFCYQRARQRSAAGNGRGRIHSRLPDARRIVAGRHQRSAAGCRKDSRVDAGSREHLAAHRTPVGPRRGDRGQQRRFLRAAEARPRPRHRRDHLRAAREGEQAIPATGCRIHPDPCRT